MNFTEDQQTFLEHIQSNDVKIFTLSDDQMEIFGDLHDQDIVETDMYGTIYRADSDETKAEQSQTDMNKRFTQNDRIEARKNAADSKERLREYAREEPQVRSLLENAETSWMYAEQEKSVEDAVKLYRLVSSAQTLAEKLMDNVSKHRNQLIDL